MATSLACVWMFCIIALNIRTDLITLGKFYLYYAQDVLSISQLNIPQGSEAYEVMKNEGILPADVVDLFFTSGGVVEVVDADDKLEASDYIKQRDGALYDAGQFSSSENKITLSKSAPKDTYAHELGHFADEYAYAYISSTKDFHALADQYGDPYAAFKKLTKDTYTVANWNDRLYTELFAEMFADTYMHPHLMQKAFPEIYDYITNLPAAE